MCDYSKHYFMMKGFTYIQQFQRDGLKVRPATVMYFFSTSVWSGGNLAVTDCKSV